MTIAGSAQLGLGYSCGTFDPVLGVAETLNQVKSGAEDMLRAMTQAATGAIASLPALILQRANPGLYELMQNALVGAKLKVDLATKDCRQMEADIAHWQESLSRARRTFERKRLETPDEHWWKQRCAGTTGS